MWKISTVHFIFFVEIYMPLTYYQDLLYMTYQYYQYIFAKLNDILKIEFTKFE